jgi:hypothetical protein
MDMTNAVHDGSLNAGVPIFNDTGDAIGASGQNAQLINSIMAKKF